MRKTWPHADNVIRKGSTLQVPGKKRKYLALEKEVPKKKKKKRKYLGDPHGSSYYTLRITDI